MIKNFILSILFTALLICGAIPQVNAYTFTLNSINISDFNEGPVGVGLDGPGLDIITDTTGFIPYTTPDLMVGGSVTFDLFDIWTPESLVNLAEDEVPRDISVEFSFSSPGATGTIYGKTVGFNEPGIVTFLGIPVFFPDMNDEGQVAWDSSADFSFGDSGIFKITLLPTSFNQDIIKGELGNWINLSPDQPFGSTVQATLLYVHAPTTVPVPPAIILLGTGILSIAGIRKKFKT